VYKIRFSIYIRSSVCFSVYVRKVVIDVILKIAFLLFLLYIFCRIRFTAVSVVMLVRYVSSFTKVCATRFSVNKSSEKIYISIFKVSVEVALYTFTIIRRYFF
jgi:hypothetical protein